MSIYKSLGVLAVSIALVMFATSVRAADEANVNIDGVAIHGYDPVAYFDPGAPIKGKKKFSARHFGVTYWFASAENLATFLENPGMYIPAYGGWCSYGVRVGRKFDIDPNAFRVVDDRLFLQLDLGTQKVWKDDIRKNIEIADRLWPKIEATPAKVLGK